MMPQTTLAPSTRNAAGWCWDHSYARLPSLLFAKTQPTPVAEPRLVVFNRQLAEELGFDLQVLVAKDSAGIFTGNQLPEFSQPLAQAYAGHQYGHFTALGDGRAILLGEHLTPDGRRFDIQLKGAGETPYSRSGDGRAALGPMLREFIISEAMHALGIPTTRSLAVATTGETVMRQKIEPGAVLTRVAASHIRVGTFQWAAAHQDVAALEALTAYTLSRHFPENFEQGAGTSSSPGLALLRAVVSSQAELVARWMLVGFVHGVMNTDNMALSGETIDYGPCAFMDAYHPEAVFSSIDRHGRYAYGNQPSVARWNLTRFAEALLPCVDSEPNCAVELVREALEEFFPQYHRHWLAGMRKKLGLGNEESEDADLIEKLLDLMQRTGMDYTRTFRMLIPATRAKVPSARATPEFADWQVRWRARLARQADTVEEIGIRMKASNPVMIPRNHLVEQVLVAAVERQDRGPMNRLLTALAASEESAIPDEFTTEPSPEFLRGYQTFCGT